MFKKIHSNRDPRDTLYSELRKEFSVYVDKGNGIFKSLLASYPGVTFGFMVTILVASLIAAVVLHHSQKPQQVTSKKSATVQPMNDGFDNILSAGQALKQTIKLRRQVDSITAGQTLTRSDSLTLLRDLDSLQHIRLTLPR